MRNCHNDYNSFLFLYHFLKYIISIFYFSVTFQYKNLPFEFYQAIIFLAVINFRNSIVIGNKITIMNFSIEIKQIHFYQFLSNLTFFFQSQNRINLQRFETFDRQCISAMSTRHTPRSERLPAIFEEIESTTHSLVTYAIKNRSMGGGEGHRRALTKLLWRHRFTHPLHTPSHTPHTRVPFSPSSTYVAFLKSSAAISPQG